MLCNFKTETSKTVRIAKKSSDNLSHEKAPLGNKKKKKVSEANKGQLLYFMSQINSGADSENEVINNVESNETSKYLKIEPKTVRSRSSGVWYYFGVQKNHSSQRILCNVCYKDNIIKSYRWSTASSNLWKHLEVVHGILPKNISRHTSVSSSGDAMHQTQQEIKLKRKSTPRSIGSSAKRKSISSQQSDLNEQKPIISPSENTVQSPTTSDRTDDMKDIGKIIIEEVAKRPALYDSTVLVSHPEKKSVKESLWLEVHDALKIAIPIIRIKNMWKNIRDRYRKLKNNGLNENGIKYKYYEDLTFLDGCDNQSDVFEDVNIKEGENVEQSYDLIEFGDKSDDVLRFYDDDYRISYKNPGSTQSELRDEEIAPKSIACSDSYRNLKMPSPAAMDCNSDTEFDTFGQLVASKLRKIAKSRVSEVEINILRILMNEEHP